MINRKRLPFVRLSPFAIVVSVTLLLLLLSPQTAFSQEERYSVFLRKLKVVVETDEVGSDTVYGLIAIANINPDSPELRSVSYTGTWGSLDAGDPPRDPRGSGLYFSGAIPNPDHLLILILLMEEDERGGPNALASMNRAFSEGLTVYVRSGLPRSEIVTNLARDIRANYRTTLRGGVVAANDDDIIDIKDVQFTTSDLDSSRTRPVPKSIEFRGDGGHYRITFELVRSIPVSGGRTAAAPVDWFIKRVDAMTPSEGPPGTVIYIDGVNFGSSGRVVLTGRGGSYSLNAPAGWGEAPLRWWFLKAFHPVNTESGFPQLTQSGVRVYPTSFV